MPPRRRQHLPTDQLIVQSTSVAPEASVRDLGVHLDSDMSMTCRCTRTSHNSSVRATESCRQLRSIRRSLPRSAMTTLVTSFIMSKVDYCNVALLGLHPVQFMNAAARLTSDARRYDHVTQLLMDLHWLRVPERIQYKLCVLVSGCLNGTAPGHLSDLTVSVGSTARCQLRSASTSDLVVPPTRWASIGTVRSPLQVQERRTVYHQQARRQRGVGDWRGGALASPTKVLSPPPKTVVLANFTGLDTVPLWRFLML